LTGQVIPSVRANSFNSSQQQLRGVLRNESTMFVARSVMTKRMASSSNTGRGKDSVPTIMTKAKLLEIENDPVALRQFIQTLTTEINANVDEDQRNVLVLLKAEAEAYLEACERIETETAEKTSQDLAVDELNDETLEGIKSDSNALSIFLTKITAAMANLGNKQSEQFYLLVGLKFLAEKYLKLNLEVSDATVVGADDELTMEKLEMIQGDPVALTGYLKKINATIDNLGDKQNYKKELAPLRKLAETYLANCRPVKGLALRSNRVADIDFQVESTELKHTYDLERITEYVMSLFDWHTDQDVRDKYMAPYFPLVQSSGMGKTKLLWELRESINKNQFDQFADFDCKTILCGTGPPDPNKRALFSDFLEANRSEGDMYRTALTRVLEDNLQSSKKKKVIFLFDETQHLLKDDGFAFRCVRWWLRLERPEKQVVAVFTGTTSRLTNFYAEPRSGGTSRDASLSYYTKGELLYDPFYDLYTIGIFADDASVTNRETEYDRAIPHGRPLFALLHKKGDLTDVRLMNILDRMLLNSMFHPWRTNIASFVSILGTRIQMGPTSVSLASELVSNGYAMLTYYAVTESKAQPDKNIARISFATDPVCARLAMAMMDEDWSILVEGKEFKGMGKKFWISKMGEIFSSGLCLPNRGDLGELAGAIYMLFCGDLLRKRIDATYKTFSVPLADFIDHLALPQRGSNNEERTQPPTQEPPSPYIDAHVSFIQVVRNYMRFSIRDLEFADILENLYASGCAFYSHPLCKTYDMVASVRLTATDQSFRYVPLLVSITTERTSKSQITELQKMQKLLKDAKTTGLCIRLLFGTSKPYSEPDELLSKFDVTTLLNGNIVSKVVVVPEKDPFDIVNLLLEITSAGPVKNEIHSSQYFLLSPKLRTNFKQAKLLRTRPGKGATRVLKEVIEKRRPSFKRIAKRSRDSKKQ
jgi:hypothetical protein